MRCPRRRAFPHCRMPRLDPVTAARRQRRVLATAAQQRSFEETLRAGRNQRALLADRRGSGGAALTQLPQFRGRARVISST